MSSDPNMKKKVKDTFHYDVLGVAPDATAAEIKKGFRRKAMQFHPDKHLQDPNGKYFKMFKEASEAYDILSDNRKRSEYDQYGTVDYTDPFDPFTWSNPRQDRNRVPPSEETVPNLTLRDFYCGKQGRFKVRRMEACPYCCDEKSLSCRKANATGRDCVYCGGDHRIDEIQIFLVRLHPGASSSTRVCFEEEGDYDVARKKYGAHEFVMKEPSSKAEGTTSKISIEEVESSSSPPSPPIPQQLSQSAQRKGDFDLWYTKTISIQESLVGCCFEIMHLDGRKIKLTTPLNMVIKHDSLWKVSGEGMPRSASNLLGSEVEVFKTKSTSLNPCRNILSHRAPAFQLQKNRTRLMEMLNAQAAMGRNEEAGKNSNYEGGRVQTYPRREREKYFGDLVIQFNVEPLKDTFVEEDLQEFTNAFYRLRQNEEEVAVMKKEDDDDASWYQLEKVSQEQPREKDEKTSSRREKLFDVNDPQQCQQS